ncbi:FAD-dependent monooxygenase, partial [Streptomyces sp. NRRL F-6676]|uniref:FAD-dependent monooxygenase n=3 Tax=unclassified Streptomyces TaxID=2593676 RepID=UPI0018FE5F14
HDQPHPPHPHTDPRPAEPLARAIRAGAEALLDARRADGVIAPAGDRFSPANTAAALIALHTARAHGATPAADVDAVRDQAVARLCATQRPDGGWAMAGVPTETFTTAVVAAALALTAPDSTGRAVAAAHDLVRRRGGVDSLPEPAMRALARQFAALADPGARTSTPRLPLELLLLPGLARRALSLRLPVFAASALGQSVRRPRRGLGGRVDRALRPRALALVREAFARERGTGSFSADPWLTALVALGVGRSELAPDLVRAAAHWLTDAARPDGGWDLMPLDLTWSSFAAAALLEAGYADDPRLAPLRTMLRDRQQDVPFEALACPPGHWGFSTDRSWPMALETAEISALLHRMPGGGDDPHVRRGMEWLTAMQDRSGSWSLAVRDSRPGGFGPCPQMTAKSVLALLDCGAGPDDPRVRKGLDSLRRAQRPDGALEAMWYRGPVPGTAAALTAWSAAGLAATGPARRARDFLLRTQLPDGSWGTAGEDPGDPAEASDGTVEETAWALHALLTAGEPPDSAPLARATAHLLHHQNPDGTWPGAPVNEYIRRCYRYADPVLATSLAVKALAASRRPADRTAEVTGPAAGTPAESTGPAAGGAGTAAHATRPGTTGGPRPRPADDYDVLVCGAGVAGLAAARGLGGLGLRVLLLDKQAAPRDVAKGEVLQPGALRVLRRWGVAEVLRERGAVSMDRLVVRDAHGTPLMALDYGQLPPGDRELLVHDHREILTALTEGLAGGVEVRRGTVVREALRTPEGRVTGLVLAGPDGDRSVRAPLVVAADGVSSRLRRAAGIPGRRTEYPHRLVSVELADAGHQGPGDFSAYLSARGLRLLYPLPGDRVRLYLQCAPDELRGLGARDFADWLARAVGEVPALAGHAPALAAAAGTRQVFTVGHYLTDRFAAPGLALVGEAGYAVHPMAAQGMNTAITSAWALTEALSAQLSAHGRTDGRPALDATAVDAALDAYRRERAPVLASAARTSANAARMVTELSWPGRAVGRRAVRHTGANPRLLHTVTHNMAGLGPLPLTPLDRLQQLGLLPDPRAHRLPARR